MIERIRERRIRVVMVTAIVVVTRKAKQRKKRWIVAKTMKVGS